MQQIQIVGNVGKDAFVKQTNGNEFLTFSVCVTESYTNKNGDKIENSTWYSCVGRQTKICQFIKKGDKIMVQGELKAKIFTNDKRESSIDLSVSIDRIELLGGKKSES